MSRKRILLICPNPEDEAPGQRLKYEQYFDYLRANGYDITVSPFITKAFWRIIYKPGHYGRKILWTLWGYARRLYDLARAPFYDGLYIFLSVTPFGTSCFERLYRVAARKIVYDIDDLVFLGKTSSANKIVGWLRGRSKYVYLMKCADHAITCTPYLDKFVRQYNRRTTDISSTINTDTYVPCNSYSNRSQLVIGWSGSHSTAPYLHLLDGALARLRKKIDFKLLVIGDAGFTMPPGIEVEAIAWQQATEVRDLSRFDIGLYPLPDEEWVYGKSGLKALQYMALGVPTVAAAIGTNFRVIEDGVSGFLVKNEDEWLERLERLALDPALRRRLGESARQRVEAQFSIKANRDTYLGIFRSIYG
ncbi:MAG: glycosyltransferase family 4 protein [Deltaproteobacteria bacterium]|nr:glycosyltransferase family 4 protein [Deltaproteobacteria bacterium]